ncbi:T9SS type A sorting domain-containing protein [Weeksella virosa]|uniref:Secretion system C-terminal sorting domain-containing protein n=1 Tax=Weeksella virosa (strain ATCC 43766 / DSM 16922 / JCM 21250 / CCUG 30538 / CDC 9751 / IAM 14551 / NBRC 16016 / NCTC 11634 / CL345/78) TaxID=865938 RepID=F0P1J8_WEEVC|nr:T9SS type A sorting domain-containing protein [Weeksella virosa]ADX67626.1 hypothetical protein Weevi_0915 [Weeksella virosa DSM 16922]VEH64749.1 Por secretion system C-terminal sorting domain [Weeksella virosa]
MKILLQLALFASPFIVFAQYTSPNSGVVLHLQDIANADNTTISVDNDNPNTYYIHKNITISANDKLVIDKDYWVYISDEVLLNIEGTIEAIAPNRANFTVQNPETESYQGIRLDEFSTATFKNISFSYGGGIRALSGHFLAENCSFSYMHDKGISTGGAISFSRGTPKVINSQFLHNETPAVGSAANSKVGLIFENNYLENNNTKNTNRPQINMGPSGENQQIIIKNNTIIGNRDNTRVGGIAVASLVGLDSFAIIDGNIVKDNRYGITLVGPKSGGDILNNQLINNNSENLPMQGGSGISITQPGNVLGDKIRILDNHIENNLWGITLIGEATNIFMGDATTPGNNFFYENGNNGETFALYNNSPNEVIAQGNCWIAPSTTDLSAIENVIFHRVDNPSLGLVDYSNPTCTMSVNDQEQAIVSIYPNPVEDFLFWQSNHLIQEVEVFSINGEKQMQLSPQKTAIYMKHLSKGVYIVQFTTQNGEITRKKIIKK